MFFASTKYYCRVKRSARNRMKLKTFAREFGKFGYEIFFSSVCCSSLVLHFSALALRYFPSPACRCGRCYYCCYWTEILKLLIWNEGDFSTGNEAFFLFSRYNLNFRKRATECVYVCIWVEIRRKKYSTHRLSRHTFCFENKLASTKASERSDWLERIIKKNFVAANINRHTVTDENWTIWTWEIEMRCVYAIQKRARTLNETSKT